MRKFLPLAVLGTLGCGLRPWTPSVSVAFWAEDVPDGREYSVPTSAELAQRWQMAPDSPWARYHKSTLISSVDPMQGNAMLPDIRRLEIVATADSAATNVARQGMPQGTLWLLDMRGAASAAFVARLSHESQEPIAPVCTFNNWPAGDGLVPADETLAGLISFAPKLPPPDEESLNRAHPVFMLDSWRLAYRFDDPGEDAFDNRYMLMPSDLPDAEELKARGINKIVYVVEDLDDADVEEDDVHASFRNWQAAGVNIFLVDLPFLQKAGPPGQNTVWPGAWMARTHFVRERYTLVDDPYFYTRARGGFGLAYGRPFIYPHYRGIYGVGGYRGSGGSGYRGSGGSGG